MIYMYFKGWRLTDSLLMADMSKVYIMRRGWTLCLDGIGLAISRSQVGQVRSSGHGYGTVGGQPIGPADWSDWDGYHWLAKEKILVENSITRSWMPHGPRTTSRTILDLDGLIVILVGLMELPSWKGQNGRVKSGSGHFNPFHMTIIWPPLNVLMVY